MPLNFETVSNWTFEERRQTYTDRDTMLYALSVGFGADPLNEQELPFVYEKELRAVPSMGAVLCHLGNWLGDARTGVTRTKVVHGEQRMQFHAPLPPAASLVARARVLGVQDKGADKGALIHIERVISDADSGNPLVTIVHTSFCRADGGFGQSFGPELALHTLPQRAPDFVLQTPVREDAAILYRLNIDRNPLHIDPQVAQRAGFPRPILHGLCTYGIAARLLVQSLDYQPERLASLDARFSSVVYPGETLALEGWQGEGLISFRVKVPARDQVVLDNGCAQLR